MLRSLFLALSGLALAALVATDRSPKALAADADITGNWQLSTVAATGESAVCILKVETKDGKPSASVLFSPPNTETSVTNIRATDTAVNLTLKQTRTVKDQKTGKEQKFTTETEFVGVRGKDAKVILGSTGTDRFRTRAKLTATDKEKLAPNEMTIRAELPPPMAEVQKLSTKAGQAQGKMLAEKDPAKKKELQKEFAEALKELNEKQPALFRETVEKHADSPAAYDAATALLRTAAQTKLTADEAANLVKLARKHAEPYGPMFTGVTFAPIAGILARQKGLEAAAVAIIEPSAKAVTDDYSTTLQFEVLDAYKFVLEKAGKSAEAKALEPRVAKLDTTLDANYLKAVPPFKPTAFAGRKDRSANQVVVMELFTGAQCPPCVAADVAFDGLLKTYKPTDVVLIQYHVHIPGPDPLTTPDTTARFNYYRDQFPEEVRGAPTSVFNGKPQTGGGGNMAAGEAKYKQYTGVIDPLLEKSTEVKVGGKATRNGDKIDIAVDVANAGGADMKLRIVVIEENIKYVGSNAIRFHHQVVRAMPGGADGVAIKDKAFKHAATTDLAEVRKELNKYLDEYGMTRPFPKPDRPMEMKNLRVIAFVQNDKTKEIVQAVQFDVEGKAGGGGGR